MIIQNTAQHQFVFYPFSPCSVRDVAIHALNQCLLAKGCWIFKQVRSLTGTRNLIDGDHLEPSVPGCRPRRHMWGNYSKSPLVFDGLFLFNDCKRKQGSINAALTVFCHVFQDESYESSYPDWAQRAVRPDTIRCVDPCM